MRCAVCGVIRDLWRSFSVCRYLLFVSIICHLSCLSCLSCSLATTFRLFSVLFLCQSSVYLPVSDGVSLFVSVCVSLVSLVSLFRCFAVYGVSVYEDLVVGYILFGAVRCCAVLCLNAGQDRAGQGRIYYGAQMQTLLIQLHKHTCAVLNLD